MLLTKTVKINVTSRTFNHYKNKGYSIPMKYSEKSKKEALDSNIAIFVNALDLPASSHIKIRYRCDNCGEEFETDYCNWNQSKYKELGDLCKDCAMKIKLPKAMQDKYGYSNAAQVPSIVDKKKQTDMKKYDNEWHIASSKVRDNIVGVWLGKYGTDNPMKNEEVKKKAIETNNYKYGGNSSLCCEEIKEKVKRTCLLKYGVKNPAQSKEIQSKIRETLYSNGTVPTSKAEKQMCAILEDIFGEENCFPNYPEVNLSLDCLVVLGNYKIDFEYDGKYWHQDRAQHDAARNAVLMNNGYKIVRIKGNNQDDMPTRNQILDAVDYLVKDNHHLVFIDMNI